MSSKRQKSKVISDPTFGSGGSLTNNEFKRLCVNSFNGAASILVEDFNDSPVGLIGLELGADNRDVSNAVFLVQGSLFNDPKTINGSSWFSLDDSLTIKLLQLNCEKFVFGNKLTSDLVDWTEIDCEIRSQGRVVSGKVNIFLGFLFVLFGPPPQKINSRNFISHST